MWCISVDMLVCFFFFKQKTAYEMRISDWSSDVCSSDLIGECVVDAPPVNALGRDVRQALLDAVAEAAADPVVEALVIRCAGRTFFAGADIREFGKPPLPPSLPEVIAAIDRKSTRLNSSH